MNATGQADFESYYNFVERIQKRMLRSNLRYLLAVIFTAGLHTGEIKEMPEIKVKFNPLWSVSDSEQAALDLQKAQLESTKAQTAIQYIQAQVLDPTEVRKKLADSADFDVETMLDDYTEEELEENAPSGGDDMGGMNPDMMAQMMGGGGMPAGASGGSVEPQEADGGVKTLGETQEDAGVPVDDSGTDENYAEFGNSPESAPEATKLPQDMEINARFGDSIVTQRTLPEDADDKHIDAEGQEIIEDTGFLYDDNARRIRSVGVIVEKDGKFLTGFRHNDYMDGTLCGPGGHIEGLETAREAAIRETREEFGIIPTEMTFLGLGEYEEDSGLIPAVFLCTKFEGIIENSDMEMIDIRFRTLEEIAECDLFKPFEDSLFMLADTLKNEEISQNVLTNLRKSDIMYQEDGGPGSGNHGHGGRPGQIGGSAPEAVSASVLRNKIKNGELSTEIKPRQKKHFAGTDLYKEECEKAKAENRALPGYLTISEKELADVLKETRGTGNAMKFGDSYREFVDTGKVVGVYIDRQGNEIPTTKLMVHYGYMGCHAVPGNPLCSAKPKIKDEEKKDSANVKMSTDFETKNPELTAVESAKEENPEVISNG